MPTKKAIVKPPAYTPPRRHDDGHWLCNTVDGCDQVAIMQGVLQCGAGCAYGAGHQFTANLQLRRDELASVDSREESVKAAVESRWDEPFNASLNLLDQLELRAIAERRKVLGTEIEALEAAHAAAIAEHTHPLFACDKHASKLPD